MSTLAEDHGQCHHYLSGKTSVRAHFGDVSDARPEYQPMSRLPASQDLVQKWRCRRVSRSRTAGVL